jgi:D-serine deaminase-like pyridoxal phosphate-dependent protein
MTMPNDHRQAAESRVRELIELLRAQAASPELQALIGEAESLERAVRAFHMEGIRFRMYNVDRLMTRGGLTLPEAATNVLAHVRRELEAAGFHTRSHQAPT